MKKIKGKPIVPIKSMPTHEIEETQKKVKEKKEKK